MDIEQNRELLCYMAKVHETTEDFELMIRCMKEICEMKVELSSEEGNLLSIGFKQLVGAKRNSWRSIKSIEESHPKVEDDLINDEILKRVTIQRQSIEREIRRICNDLIQLVDTKIIPTTSKSSERLVFYYKLKADYYRYIAETSSNENDEKQLEEEQQQAKEAYEFAEKHVKNLDRTNPTRLGLFLNYSVFIHEIMNDTQSAIQVAERCFEEAMEELDELSKDEYNDCVTIMQLLRDNIKIWSCDIHGDNDDDEMIQEFIQ